MREHLSSVIGPGKRNGQERRESAEALWVSQVRVLEAKAAFFQRGEQHLNIPAMGVVVQSMLRVVGGGDQQQRATLQAQGYQKDKAPLHGATPV